MKRGVGQDYSGLNREEFLATIRRYTALGWFVDLVTILYYF